LGIFLFTSCNSKTNKKKYQNESLSTVEPSESLERNDNNSTQRFSSWQLTLQCLLKKSDNNENIVSAQDGLIILMKNSIDISAIDICKKMKIQILCYSIILCHLSTSWR